VLAVFGVLGVFGLFVFDLPLQFSTSIKSTLKYT